MNRSVAVLSTAMAGMLALTLTCGSIEAMAAPAPPANLSITLSDGVGQVHSGMTVRYVARLSNGGSTKVRARLQLATPAYVTITKAGTKHPAHSATWTVVVAAHETVTRTVTARIATIAHSDFRVTTLASVWTGAGATTPTVRTADADRIAGVVDPAHTVTSPAATTSDGHGGGGSTGWIIAAVIAAAVVLLLVGGLWWWRRSRRGDGGDGYPAPDLDTHDLSAVGLGSDADR